MAKKFYYNLSPARDMAVMQLENVKATYIWSIWVTTKYVHQLTGAIVLLPSRAELKRIWLGSGMTKELTAVVSNVELNSAAPKENLGITIYCMR